MHIYIVIDTYGMYIYTIYIYIYTYGMTMNWRQPPPRLQFHGCLCRNYSCFQCPRGFGRPSCTRTCSGCTPGQES